MNINLIELEVHGDERGSLISLEKDNNIPFEVKRVYYLFGTKKGSIRGLHAHKRLKQLVVVIHGECRFLLDNGHERLNIVLNDPTKALILDSMVWREIHDISEDCVCMVLADDVYDETDYIRSYDEFMNQVVQLKV